MMVALLTQRLRIPTRLGALVLCLSSLTVIGPAHADPEDKWIEKSFTALVTYCIDPPYGCVRNFTKESNNVHWVEAEGKVYMNAYQKKWSIHANMSTICRLGTAELYVNGKTAAGEPWYSESKKIYDETCDFTKDPKNSTSNEYGDPLGPSAGKDGYWDGDDKEFMFQVAFDPTLGKRVWGEKVWVDMTS